MHPTSLSKTVAIAAVSIALAAPATASGAERWHHRTHAAGRAAAGHPLTIGGRPRGLYRVGNAIVAPGGFGAHGFGYPEATPEERREALNASIRARSSGLYAYYGAGGVGGYANPYYGNSFNRYTGYNGLPGQLAFGPGFANRHITGHDPFEDEDPGPPSPADLGYRPGDPGAE